VRKNAAPARPSVVAAPPRPEQRADRTGELVRRETLLGILGHAATQTLLMPPEPRCFTIRYAPIRVPSTIRIAF
jgi:hypothetical protein